MMKNSVAGIGRGLTIGVLLTMSATAQAGWWGRSAEDRQIVKAISRVYPALVRIDVVMEDADDGRLKKQQGSGSGTIIDKEGYIITNHHVAGKARRLVCRMSDGREVPARLVGTDPLSDIAIIQMDLTALPQDEKLPTAVFGDSTQVKVGEVVLAMGSPGGVNQSVTRGIASNTALLLPPQAAAMSLDGENVGSLVQWIAHDAQIFPGNSGGPLVNLKGEIIGINEIGVVGLGGAIPGNLARSIARQLIETGEVRRSWTGIQIQTRLKGQENIKGVLVGGVLPDSPAAAAGIRAGDVITEFSGQEVDARISEDLPRFNALLLGAPIGDPVPVKILRDGKPMEFRLVTTRREPARNNQTELKDWGLTAMNLTQSLMLELRRSSRDGVLVGTVRPGGPAGAAEPALQPGDILTDVNGHAVTNVAALVALTDRFCRGRKEPLPVLVSFERNRNRIVTVARVGGERPAESPIPSRKAEFPVTLQAVNAELAEKLGLKESSAARITFIIPGRSADRAGFKVGDVIVKMDDEPVRTSKPEDIGLLSQSIRRYRIGSTIAFTVIRDGKPRVIPLKLEESADTAEEPARYTDIQFELSVREMMMMDRVVRQLGDEVKGVLIESVENASFAQLAGLRMGDILICIDGHPTPDVPSAEKELKAAAREKRDTVVFFIRRGITTRFLEVEPNWNGVGEKSEKKTEKSKENKA